MRKFVLAAGIALLVSGSTGVATADPILVTDPASAWGWDGLYFKAYGGFVQPGEATYSGSIVETYDRGGLVGGAIGVGGGIDNLSVELDVTSSTAARTGAPSSTLHALTLMLNGVYTLPLSDRFSLYGGAGLGLVRADIPGAAGAGFGGQAFGGAAFQVTDAISLFAEGRVQSTLGDVTLDDGVSPYPVSFSRTAILAGIKVGM
jgi:opacity protein-like surface antigen